MAQYVTKFEAWRTATFAQDDNAVAPAGWTPRYGGFSADSKRVAMPTGPVKKYGWSSRSVFFGYQWAAGMGASWDVVDADASRANAEILMGVRAVPDIDYFLPDGFGTEVNDIGAAFVRGQTLKTHYAAVITNTVAPSVLLYRLSSGGATLLLGSAAVTVDASGLYYLRLRANGSTISAKGWGRDAEEPSSWTVSVTNAQIAAAGYCGVLFGCVEFASVGTNGDTALMPQTLVSANAQLAAAVTGGKPVLLTCDLEAPGYTGSPTVAGRVFRRYSNLPYNTGSIAPLAGEVYDARMKAIPSVAREMLDLTGGIVKVGGADVQLANGDGALDDLFRMRLFRMSAVCRIGLPTWPWYDLLPYHQGVIQDVSDDGGQTVTLAVDGTARELDGDVTLTYSTTGVNDKKPLPQQYGGSRNLSPTLVDSSLLRYQYGTSNRSVGAVRDRGVLLTTTNITLVAFDAAADWMESSAAHNLLVGDPYTLTGTPPSPLNTATTYFVQSVVTTSRFTASATRGGALINLTGTTGAITATAVLQPWINSVTAGAIELSRQPVGQVTLDVSGTTASFVDLLAVLGLSQAKCAIQPGYNANALFNLFFDERTSRMSVIDDMAARGVPVTFSRSGALAWRKINFANIEATFTEADCFGAPKLTKTLQPTAGRVGEPNWTVQSPTDLAGSVTPANVALYGLPQYYLITALGIDYQQGLWWGGLVDDPALYRDTLPDKSVGGIAATNVLTGTGYTTLNSNDGRQRAAGVYEITVAFKSVLLDCGDVVKLTHRRHFFRDVINEIDVSPERPATAIGAQRQPSLAVVTKIVDDLANSRQTLTLYRPMPTLFPAS